MLSVVTRSRSKVTLEDNCVGVIPRGGCSCAPSIQRCGGEYILYIPALGCLRKDLRAHSPCPVHDDLSRRHRCYPPRKKSTRAYSTWPRQQSGRRGTGHNNVCSKYELLEHRSNGGTSPVILAEPHMKIIAATAATLFCRARALRGVGGGV